MTTHDGSSTDVVPSSSTVRSMLTNACLPSVTCWTPPMLKISRLVNRIPGLGRYLRYAIPVVNYEGVYPLSEAQLREWAVLDTFDMLAPAHDHPQRRGTVHRWFSEAGLRDVEVERIGFYVARGTKPEPQSMVTNV